MNASLAFCIVYIGSSSMIINIFRLICGYFVAQEQDVCDEYSLLSISGLIWQDALHVSSKLND